MLSAQQSGGDDGKRVGRFRLLEKVGSGGFGDVWKALDPVLDRIVAVKIPRRALQDAGETELFLREARTIARLHHPRIVAVHEAGIDNGVPYLVSDFVTGANLQEWLGRGRPTFAD